MPTLIDTERDRCCRKLKNSFRIRFEIPNPKKGNAISEPYPNKFPKLPSRNPIKIANMNAATLFIIIMLSPSIFDCNNFTPSPDIYPKLDY